MDLYTSSGMAAGSVATMVMATTPSPAVADADLSARTDGWTIRVVPGARVGFERAVSWRHAAPPLGGYVVTSELSFVMPSWNPVRLYMRRVTMEPQSE